MTRAVIFDLFGTLVPKWPRAASIANREAMAEMLGAEQEPFRDLWRATFIERETGRHPTLAASLLHICERLGLSVSEAQAEAAARTRLELHRERMAPRIGALETLRALRESGLQVGLISNAGPAAPVIWPETPMAALVHAATFSSLEGTVKPDPAIYHATTGRLQVDAAACLYVGDGGGEELTAARALGMHAVLLDDPDPDGSTGPGDESATWDGDRVAALPEITSFLA